MRYENVTKFTEAFIKAVQQPSTPVATTPEIQRTIRQDIRDLTPPAALQPTPPKAAVPVEPIDPPTVRMNVPVVPPPSSSPQHPHASTMKVEYPHKVRESGLPAKEVTSSIPPMRWAEPSDPNSKRRPSIVSFVIIGLVILGLIVGALIVVPKLSSPSEPTIMPTDMFAALAASQAAGAAAAITTEVASPTASEAATSTFLPATDTVEPSVVPSEQPTDVPPTATLIPTTEVPPTETPIPPTVVAFIISTDTPTRLPTTAVPTSTKTATMTATPTVAASKTLMPTVTASKTATPTLRPSNTPTVAPTKTPIPTATKTATATATATYTPSPTATATITPSPTPSATPTVPPLNVLDLLTEMRDAGRRANQFNCVDYIKAFDGLQAAVSTAPDDAKVAVVVPLLEHSNDAVTTLYTFCKLPANADQSRVLLRSNLANNQYRVWGSLISQAISDVEALG